MINQILLLLISVLIYLSTNVFSQEIPVIRKYVTDNASVLSIKEYGHIDSLCKNIFSDSIAQIVVLIEKQLPREAKKYNNLVAYASEIAELNGIGRKDIDDGIVILIAIKERKIAIANGYLIGDILPDSTTDRIIRKVITPQFKENRYVEGISKGIEELKKEIIRRKKYMYPEKYKSH